MASPSARSFLCLDQVEDDSMSLRIATDRQSSSPLCLYRGRPCHEPRDVKLNGRLHRYCHSHRLRHNQYQRDSQRRRAEARLAQRGTISESLHQLELTNCLLDVVDQACRSHSNDGYVGGLAPDELFASSLHDTFLSSQAQSAQATFSMDHVLFETDDVDDLLDFLFPPSEE